MAFHSQLFFLVGLRAAAACNFKNPSDVGIIKLHSESRMVPCFSLFTTLKRVSGTDLEARFQERSGERAELSSPLSLKRNGPVKPVMEARQRKSQTRPMKIDILRKKFFIW